MRIKKVYQKPGPQTQISILPQESLNIDGVTYEFPQEAGPGSVYQVSLPILEAYRDTNGTLHVCVLYRSDEQPGPRDWEEVSDALPV